MRVLSSRSCAKPLLAFTRRTTCKTRQGAAVLPEANAFSTMDAEDPTAKTLI